MEPSRFDELTKALATATSRRQALKAIAATVGGTLGLSRIGTVFAKPKPCTPNGKHCDSKTICCSGFCDPTTNKCATPTTTTTSTTTSTTTTSTTTSTTTTTPAPQNICTSGGDGCNPAASVQCAVSTNTECVCATDINGSFVCWDSGSSLGGCANCASDADCGPNMACVQAACCATGFVCVSLCSSLPVLGCHPGSTCESVCPNTSNPLCVCGTTMAGEEVCYNSQDGCLGTLCNSDADCGPGNACVNKNDGCGGCDNITGGKGVCSPICTS